MERERYQVENLALIRNYVNQIENAAIDCYITDPREISAIQDCLIKVLHCLKERRVDGFAAGCTGDGDCPRGWVCADGYCTPRTKTG